MVERRLTGFDVMGQVATYMTKKELGLVQEAMSLSEWQHRNQRRQEPGKLFFTHPLAVAACLAQERCDAVTIAAAFLHDVVEDTDYALQEIETDFGVDVAFIVDAVTKITHTDGGKACEQCTIDKITAAAARDHRVLLIKLADRIHNLQTLQYMSDRQKQRQKIDEALSVYLPLAEAYQLTTLAKRLEAVALVELKRLNHLS